MGEDRDLEHQLQVIQYGSNSKYSHVRSMEQNIIIIGGGGGGGGGDLVRVRHAEMNMPVLLVQSGKTSELASVYVVYAHWPRYTMQDLALDIII